MAKAASPDGEVMTQAGYDESDFQWSNVHEEAPDQVLFENIGDKFVGLYLGSEVIEFEDSKGDHQEFTQLKFRIPAGPVVINAGYELREAFKSIAPESMVRIELIKFVKIRNQQSPMSSFRVDVAQARA